MRSKLILLFALFLLGLQANVFSGVHAQLLSDYARERIISMPLCSSELSPCRSAARQVNHSARGNHGRGAISMTGAAWKDTLTNLEATAFESSSSEPLHRSGSERRYDDVAVRTRRTEQNARPVVWQAGIKPGHPSPIPMLSNAQKQALTEAWHAGYHVGLPLAFTAIVYVESSGCAQVHGDNGLAFGCSQVHASAAYAATGAHIPAWMLSDSNLRALNMAVGARYLQMCIDRFGWPAGAGCYNHGLHTRLSRRALSHLRYTKRVLAAMVWLKNLPMSED